MEAVSLLLTPIYFIKTRLSLKDHYKSSVIHVIDLWYLITDKGYRLTHSWMVSHIYNKFWL